LFDTEINRWRRRKNKEIREITKVPPITSYIKGQRIQWFGHAMRREETQMKSEQQLNTSQQTKDPEADRRNDGWMEYNKI